MSELTDLKARLANVQGILSRGATSAVINGLRVDYDFEALRREESSLRRRIGAITGGSPTSRRIVFSSGR